MVEAVESSIHCTSTHLVSLVNTDHCDTYSAILSRVNRVKSSVTLILSLGPNRAHLTTNCEAISCISSYIDRIDNGPKAIYSSSALVLMITTWYAPGISVRCATSQLCSPVLWRDQESVCIQSLNGYLPNARINWKICQKGKQHNPESCDLLSSKQSIFDSIPNLKQCSSIDWFLKAFLITYFVEQFLARYENLLDAADSKSEDGPYTIHQYEDYISLEAQEDLPYVSASNIKLFIESEGSISRILPRKGSPLGPGIGSVMTVTVEWSGWRLNQQWRKDYNNPIRGIENLYIYQKRQHGTF